MQNDIRCHTCLLSRVILECELAGVTPEQTHSISLESKQLLDFLLTTNMSHPAVASIFYRFVHRSICCDDPFSSLKRQSNENVANMIRRYADRIPGWSFRDLVTAAVIGNSIDYGVQEYDVSDDFAFFFEEEWKSGLKIDDTDEMLPLLDRIVYLTDNCGEVILDRELIRYLKNKGSDITLVARTLPILNDATCDDIIALGIDSHVNRIYPNSNTAEIGIRFDQISAELLYYINNATLIISKGMANYESLREFQGLPPVAYLLTAKCLPVAEQLHVTKGSKLALLRL
ncbi:MAG: ARMT1-like domain-containing protein [Euryarchaeota archaeon]|nr:ARMT1-like domain-containing protein [Euryarchaeota archaeon]